MGMKQEGLLCLHKVFFGGGGGGGNALHVQIEKCSLPKKRKPQTEEKEMAIMFKNNNFYCKILSQTLLCNCIQLNAPDSCFSKQEAQTKLLVTSVSSAVLFQHLLQETTPLRKIHCISRWLSFVRAGVTDTKQCGKRFMFDPKCALLAIV